MSNLSVYNDFFIFLGGLFILGGLIYIFPRSFLKKIFVSDEEITKLKTSTPIKSGSNYEISFPKISKSVDSNTLLEKKLQLSIKAILFAIIIGIFLLNQILMWKMNASSFLNNILNINNTILKR